MPSSCFIGNKLPELNPVNIHKKAKHECRKYVYDVKNHFYYKIYDKDWQWEMGIMGFITLFPTQRLRKRMCLPFPVHGFLGGLVLGLFVMQNTPAIF